MRRSDRECPDQEFLQDVLHRAQELQLALHTDDYPYVISLNFALLDGALYMHCATEGRKLDLIAADPRVAFTACVDVRVDCAHRTTYYKSVCGIGHAVLVTDVQEKERALQAISRKYASLCANPTPEALLRRTGIIRVDMVRLTGKRHLPKH